MLNISANLTNESLLETKFTEATEKLKEILEDIKLLKINAIYNDIPNDLIAASHYDNIATITQHVTNAKEALIRDFKENSLI
jgi:hypothetical protein